MSSKPTEPVPQTPNRRQHPRRKPDDLTYLNMGPDNGGFLLDVSETGVGFQGIISLQDGQVMDVRFKLPGSKTPMRATAQFVRSGISEKGGGLRFAELPEEGREQIRRWVAGEELVQEAPSGPADTVAEANGVAESGWSKTVTDEGTSSLAAELAKVGAEASPETPAEPAQLGGVLVPVPTQDAPTLDPEKFPNLQNIASGQPAATSRPEIEALPGETSPAPASNAQDNANASKITGVAARWAIEEPRLPAVIGSPNSIVPKSSRTIGGLPANGQTVVLTPKLFTTPAKAAATKGPSKPGRQGLTPLQAAKLQGVARQSVGAGEQILQFTAGLATGWLTLAAIAAGLIYTGQLRGPELSTAPTSASSTSTPPDAKSFQMQIVDLNDRRWTIAMPSPDDGAPPGQASPPGQQAAPSASSTATGVARLSTGYAVSRPSALALETRAPAAIAEPSAGASLAATPEPAVSRSGVPASSFRPATLVSRVEPVYPKDARSEHGQSSVQIMATIGKDGVPRTLRYISGQPQLAAAAIAAVEHWRYKPATLDGQAQESQIIITVNFPQ